MNTMHYYLLPTPLDVNKNGTEKTEFHDKGRKIYGLVALFIGKHNYDSKIPKKKNHSVSVSVNVQS